jgi:hypothetical protein
VNQDGSQEEIRDPNAGSAQAFSILKRQRPSMFSMSPHRGESFSTPFLPPASSEDRVGIDGGRASQDYDISTHKKQPLFVDTQIQSAESLRQSCTLI